METVRHSVPQALTRPHTRRGQFQAAQVGAQVKAPLAPLALVPRQELAQLAVVEALPQAPAISPGCQERPSAAASGCTARAWAKRTVAHSLVNWVKRYDLMPIIVCLPCICFQLKKLQRDDRACSPSQTFDSRHRTVPAVSIIPGQNPMPSAPAG